MLQDPLLMYRFLLLLHFVYSMVDIMRPDLNCEPPTHQFAIKYINEISVKETETQTQSERKRVRE